MKILRLHFDQHLRLDKNAEQIDTIMPELGLSYRLTKFLRIKAGYRFIYEMDYDPGDQDTPWHRFFVDARFRHRFKPITLRYRLRYQEQFERTGNNHRSRHTLRNKASIGWNAGEGLGLFLSGELFLRFGDVTQLLHKWRATLGCEFEVGSNRFTLFYRLDEILDDPDDPTAHILGIGYHYDL